MDRDYLSDKDCKKNMWCRMQRYETNFPYNFSVHKQNFES